MRLYYASDIHGSEVCWRKFLNAGAFYRADALIMGGDIVGKAIVPIEITRPGAGSAIFRGRSLMLESEADITLLEKEIRDAGFYPYRGSHDELEALEASDEARQELFEQVVTREIGRWLAIAEEKHDPTITAFVMGGNDDPWFVDDQLRTSDAVTFCDQTVLSFGEFDLLSLSFANRTPWNSPRELDEADLLGLIETLAHRLREEAIAIFNLHVPPYDSSLDEAPHLDANLKPITRGGQVEMVPVGSSAVRTAIERYQPALGLHGHIHESRGERHIGNTLAVNPGSDYGSGRIHGALIEFRKGRIRSHQLVSG